jgi:hypothetical protein
MICCTFFIEFFNRDDLKHESRIFSGIAVASFSAIFLLGFVYCELKREQGEL